MDFNPSFPDQFGLEWLVDRDQKSRVYNGSPARLQRIISTDDETIEAIKLSACVDPLLRATIPTVVEIIEEGDEFVPIPKVAALAPTADGTNEGWIRHNSSSSNLFQSIDRDSSIWPDDLTAGEWIQTTTAGLAYNVSVDAGGFDTGQALDGSRICFVAVEAIMSANFGFSKCECKLNIGGNFYAPAGGAVRDVHAFGEIYRFFWGEINPDTGLPWLPADIADFASGGSSFVRFRSSPGTTASRFPRVHAVRMNVHYIEVENRVAVGTWTRPTNPGSSRLVNITTDSLISVPSGSADWAKADATNYLLGWRQAMAPAIYGPTVADDVRWNGGYQDLAADGQPPGIVYPLHHSGEGPPPDDVLASQLSAYDTFGRYQDAFEGNSRAAYAFALVRDDAAISADSQPYRMDLADVVTFTHNSGTTGQRFTPSSNQTYVAFRCPIIPPFAEATLTVSVHQVSNGNQVGGSFTATALEVGKAKHSEAGLRHLYGIFSSPVALSSGTQYELRFDSTLTGAGTDNWIVFAPDCSLGATAGFKSTTDGAVINGSHTTTRDMAVTLLKQPDPAENVVAAITTVNVDMPDGSTREVEHVEVTWDAPDTPLTTSFRRYELERQFEFQDDWTRIAHLNDNSLTSFTDYMAARNIEVKYRVRQVALDGRVSAWAESNAVTPSEGDYDIILTSNHRPDLQILFEVPDSEASYEFRSQERDEVVALHGTDLQTVFSEPEDRGVGWSANVELNFGDEPPPVRAGARLFEPLLDIIRTEDAPFCCAMDYQGVRILGKVTIGDPKEHQPGNQYTASMSVIPTHDEDVPVEVDP